MNDKTIEEAVKEVEITKNKDGRPFGKGKPKHRLTAKKTAFISNVAKGMSPSDAYKNAYNVRTNNKGSINSTANKIMKDPLVSSKLNEALEVNIEDAKVARTYVIRELLKHSQQSSDALAIRSLELIGRSVGMFTDKVETKDTTVSTERLKKELDDTLKEFDENFVQSSNKIN